MKAFLYKYRHAAALLYFPFYILWFELLGHRGEINWHMIESPLDAYIPFLEGFIIPYYLWFAFVPGVMIFFFFKSKEAFVRCAIFLFTGMTISLITFTAYPTAVDFRPVLSELGRSNLCISLTEFMYSIDPGTNVLPSIHCFNSLGLMVAVFEEECTKKHLWLRIISVILGISISLSTVLVKQHSIIDIFYALLMLAVLYCIVYLPVRIRKRRLRITQVS